MSKITQDGLYTARDLARYLGVEHTSVQRWYYRRFIPPPIYSGILIREWQGGGPIRTNVHCWSQEQADYIKTLMLPPNPDGVKGAPRITRDYYYKAIKEPDGIIETLPIPIPDGWDPHTKRRVVRREGAYHIVTEPRFG